MSIGAYIFDSIGNDWYEIDGASSAVTHWMPLPEPPREKFNLINMLRP